jgi:flagellar biosynthesis protein FlhA
MLYSPNAASIRALGIEGTDPQDRLDEGLWLDKQSWSTVQSAGLPAWDGYRMMIHQLEVQIRRNLHRFLGVQEVIQMLDEWEAQEPNLGTTRHARREQAIPDVASQVRFVQVLQSLVKEGVPVNDLDIILPAFGRGRNRSKELIDIVEAVRVSLKPQLPGNQATREWVPLPPEFEQALSQWIHKQNGHRFLAASALEIETLRNVVADLLDGRSMKDLALVVSDASLRPFIFRLLEGVLPDLVIISEAELKLKIEGPLLRKEHAQRLKRFAEIKSKRLGFDQALEKLRRYQH